MNKRYYGLDLARAVFMVLGVIYHNALIFQVGGGWRVEYYQQSIFFNVLIFIIHDFRMEAFYVIAGFFSVLVVGKYGERQALKSRLIRLGIPMIVFGFTGNFLMNFMSTEREFDNGFAYLLKGEWLGHLWFIGNLIIYNIIATPFAKYFKEDRSSVLSLKRFAIIVFLVTPMASVGLGMFGNMIYEHRLIFISFSPLYRYFAYFIVGMYLWRIRTFWLRFMSVNNSLMLFMVYVVITMLNSKLDIKSISWTGSVLLMQIESTCFAISSIGLLNAIAGKAAIVQKLVDSSYTIYLLHPPVILAYYLLICKQGINSILFFMILNVIVFGTTYYFHYLVIERNKLLLFMLNGKLSINSARVDHP